MCAHMLQMFVSAECVFGVVCLQVGEKVAGSRGEALHVYEAAVPVLPRQ